MKNLYTIFGIIGISTFSTPVAAELVRLEHPSRMLRTPVIYESISAAKKDARDKGCIMRQGAWVNLIKYGSKFSKVATRSYGSRKCEGYVYSFYIVGRR